MGLNTRIKVLKNENFYHSTFSNCRVIKHGFPPGSILHPVLFNLHIKVLSNLLMKNLNQFYLQLILM